MKKVLSLFLVLSLCLGVFAGCGNTEPETAPEVEEVVDAAPVEPEVQEEPAAPTMEDYMAKVFADPAEQTIEPCWDDFSGQEGAAITPEPGNTSATWDLSIADLFPADADCTDEEFFAKWMAVEGLTTADLDARGCRQLIITALKPDSECMTTFTCYQKQEDGTWAPVEGLTKIKGSCGKNGINHNREQGDETSPAGIYQIGTAFGNEDMPEGVKMPWRDITENSEWVGTNRSKYYNTWQELDDPNIADEGFTTDDGEHLCEYISAYALACVVRFNMPPYAVKNKGAAIFFHVSRGATAGCLGLTYDNFKKCLLWMDPELVPYILVTGYEK